MRSHVKPLPPDGTIQGVRVTAKVDYAVRAAVELVGATAESPRKGDEVAAAQGIPFRFLEAILAELRRDGLVASQRGSVGGYWLDKPAGEITIADIIRAVEGPLADVHGTAPEQLELPGKAASLRDVWVATRASLRMVLEDVTLADVAAGELPLVVERLVNDPEAWTRRRRG
jgi:Rrf2 family protein